VKEFAKFWTALAGAIGVVVAAGLLQDTTETYVTTAVAAVTAFLVYYVPNTPAEGGQ
jgi:hypothetical protein